MSGTAEALARRVGWVATDPRRPAVLRVWLFGVLAAWALLLDPLELARQLEASWQPASVYRLLPGPPGPALLVPATAVLVLAATAAALGWRTRASTVVATGLGVVLLGLPDVGLGRLYHHGALLALLLIVLLPAPWADAWTLDRWLARRRSRHARGAPAPRPSPSTAYAWPVVVALLVVAGAYAGAALAKWRASGPGWVADESFVAWLYVKIDRQVEPSALGLWVAERPALATLVAVGALAVETAAAAAVLVPRLRPVVALGVVGFHVGSLVVLDVRFGLMAAVAWLPLVLPGTGWRLLDGLLPGGPTGRPARRAAGAPLARASRPAHP